MRRPRTLSAFTEQEYNHAHELLAAKVVFMMGRKLEESDWSAVYCTAKGIPNAGWSNLKIDVTFDGRGVEHKMLSRPSNVNMLDLCGTRLMHPSATRSIRVPATDADPNEVMRDVLQQYADFIEARTEKVAQTYPDKQPDMRIGWLIWQPSLAEFLYFEEEMLTPNPDDYFAEWRTSGGGGRKESVNLWVYEKETGQKRYSITTAAGAKIQPYFDVPAPNDPNLYLFRVQGEKVSGGLIRIWIAQSTQRDLQRLIDKLDVETLSLAITNAAAEPTAAANTQNERRELALALLVTTEAYDLLTASFPGVSDEHKVQLLIRRLAGS